MFDFKKALSAVARTSGGDLLNNEQADKIWTDLGGQDTHGTLSEIIHAVSTLNEGKIPPSGFLPFIVSLDDRAQALQRVIGREYLFRQDRQDAAAKSFLTTNLAFWDEFSTAYQVCLNLLTEKTTHEKAKAYLPLITARAIRCRAMQAKWCYLRYLPAEEQIWRHLNRLYLHSETRDFNKTPVSLYRHSDAQTTCATEYIRALMLYCVLPESLLPGQIETIDGWLDHWAKTMVLERELRPARHLFAINLQDAKPPRKAARNMTGEGYRYWGGGVVAAFH
jgi:hypothetical protein